MSMNTGSVRGRVVAVLGWLPLALAACGGGMPQTIKPAIPAYIKKIHIPVFTNRSMKSTIEADFTDLVIREFQKDNRLQVGGREESDAVLEGVIVQYLKQPISYDVNNVPIQFQLRVHVAIKIVDRKTGQVIAEHDNIGGLTGGTAVFSASPQAGINFQTEIDAQRDAFEKLAKDVVNRTIYGWEKY